MLLLVVYAIHPPYAPIPHQEGWGAGVAGQTNKQTDSVQIILRWSLHSIQILQQWGA
jgi:hypothetical protein